MAALLISTTMFLGLGVTLATAPLDFRKKYETDTVSLEQATRALRYSKKMSNGSEQRWKQSISRSLKNMFRIKSNISDLKENNRVKAEEIERELNSQVLNMLRRSKTELKYSKVSGNSNKDEIFDEALKNAVTELMSDNTDESNFEKTAMKLQTAADDSLGNSKIDTRKLDAVKATRAAVNEIKPIPIASETQTETTAPPTTAASSPPPMPPATSSPPPTTPPEFLATVHRNIGTLRKELEQLKEVAGAGAGAAKAVAAEAAAAKKAAEEAAAAKAAAKAAEEAAAKKAAEEAAEAAAKKAAEAAATKKAAEEAAAAKAAAKKAVAAQRVQSIARGKAVRRAAAEEAAAAQQVQSLARGKVARRAAAARAAQKRAAAEMRRAAEAAAAKTSKTIGNLRNQGLTRGDYNRAKAATAAAREAAAENLARERTSPDGAEAKKKRLLREAREAINRAGIERQQEQRGADPGGVKRMAEQLEKEQGKQGSSTGGADPGQTKVTALKGKWEMFAGLGH